ncbi:MAG: FAD-dependent oxidoreductase [Clostridia bacterium]|nr:FAD-dependent oxidoreductase [Clostridia bacterium]
MSFVKETLETPVNYSCDVLIAGGGVAGIAAALSAARAGKKSGIETKVILLEKCFMLGGLATSGIVTIYLPICDGLGNQVCFGLGEELLRLSIEYGAEARYPAPWLDGEGDRVKKRFEVQFNPQLFAISAEKLLEKEGVQIMYGATAVSVVEENGKITHVVIEGKGGREAIEVRRSVVDSTGDADICALSKAKTEKFPDGNKLAAWYYGYGNRSYDLYMCGVHDDPGESTATDLKDNYHFSGLDTKELSESVCISHSSMIKDIKARREKISDLIPTTIATIPQVRMTRRLSGKYEQHIDEGNVTYKDTVGIYPNWRKKGVVYELPLSSLYGQEVKNLLTAGRCISVTNEMWDIIRVIPVCAVSGEGAGAAAALCDDFENADLEKIQSYLEGAGVKLHWEK